ncbi:hypothetical protein [Alteromonas antoniana]|uniref:hypothetical protein n=1 Tax=Alteromonas antoniana TaxID=2803813 RepID=UPI001C47F35B|nr:hypothetical protein [Alteromonas antoniana]
MFSEECLSFDDAYFKLLLKLACISSSTKIHNELYGRPERAPIFDEESNPYWVQWDFGRTLVRKLADYCRPLSILPTQSYLWPLLDRHYQNMFMEEYELGRVVKVETADFESLCSSIAVANNVILGGYKLAPGEVDEATGHYGEEVFWRIWLLEGEGEEPTKFHTDCYTLAQDVFKIVNGRSTDDSDYGENSKKLEGYCHSIYDN